MLPRKKWTRSDVPLFHKNPNHCALTFNEELHGIVGTDRVIRAFKPFSSSGRGNGQKDSLPTICKKFYRRDGLHPNEVGSQLLGALISQSVFKALKEGKSPSSNQQRLPLCVENEPEAIGSAIFVRPTPSQSKSALPQMIFRDTYVPPPPMEDPHHFPHLSPLVDEVETNSRPEDVDSFPLVLSGYSEAVKREVIVPNAHVQEQKPLHRVRHTRTCKYNLINYILSRAKTPFLSNKPKLKKCISFP